MTFRHRSTLTLGVALAVAALALTACSATPAADPSPVMTPATAATTPPENPSNVPTVPGYDVGDFPPVPLFLLPDMSLLGGSADQFTFETDAAFAGIPGVTVTAAQCDARGTVIAGQGTAYLYGDGSGRYIGADGLVENFGDGSGKRVDGSVVIENYGDGSGKYVGDDVVIENYGDGSGKYIDDNLVVEIYGDGSGKYVDDSMTIENYGDGSGKYVDDDMIIENYGDGSGKYIDGALIIHNLGDGTGRVGSTTVQVTPLPPVPKLGVFPPIDALAPLESCGTIVTFDSAVLFDFDRSDIRPDAGQTLDTVATALAAADLARATVSGHTDAIGTDSYNQRLSEDRAASVVAALTARGVTMALTAEGHGESRPVAANEIDGVDNPAGRQLNRRVDIFLPATL